MELMNLVLVGEAVPIKSCCHVLECEVPGQDSISLSFCLCKVKFCT